MGKNFVAEEIDGEIVVWGGVQRQPDSSYVNLPPDLVFVYHPPDDFWRVIPATGDIPSHSVHCASAVVDQLLFVFGGVNRNNEMTNEIHSFCLSTGVFRRLPVQGLRPAPRRSLQGWSYEGQLYFFGGGRTEAAGETYLPAPASKYKQDNLLACFDPQTHSWTAVETTGPPPSPRQDYAAAQLEDVVIIHGGDCEKGIMDSMFELNLTTRTWRQVEWKAWLGLCLCNHSLVTISPKHLLLTGGYTGSISNQVGKYDASKAQWTKLNMLSPDLSKSVHHHRAVAVKAEQGIIVVVLGGQGPDFMHPSQMLVFHVE